MPRLREMTFSRDTVSFSHREKVAEGRMRGAILGKSRAPGATLSRWEREKA
jgi:hypothetical protein